MIDTLADIPTTFNSLYEIPRIFEPSVNMLPSSSLSILSMRFVPEIGCRMVGEMIAAFNSLYEILYKSSDNIFFISSSFQFSL